MAEKGKTLWADMEPGTRRKFILEVKLKEGGILPLPGYIVRGKNPGATLYIQAAQHGTELNGIEAVLEIALTLDPEMLSGTLLAVPFSNPLATRARTYLPPGQPNAFLSWPGDPEGENVQRIVHTLYHNLVRHADAVLDYHGINDRYASSIWLGKYEHARSLEMAKVFGLACIVQTTANGHPRTAEAPGLRIGQLEGGPPAIFVEPRGEMVTRSDSVTELVQGARSVMKWLGMLSGPMVKPAFRTGKLKVEVKASREGMYLPKAEPGTLVGEGELLGKLISIDTLDVEEIRAPRSGFLYMNGRYERDGHTLNDLANVGETVAIIHEVLAPDGPNLEFSLHGLCYGSTEG